MNIKPVIVGIGEILWDVFADGAVLGGAPANFACHSSNLGAEAWIVGAVGGDVEGKRAREILSARGVSCDLLVEDPEHVTGRVDVHVGADGQPSYEFLANAAWDHLNWTAEMGNLAARCDAVCFGTLGQRAMKSRMTIQRFVAATPEQTFRVFDVNLRQEIYTHELICDCLELATAVKLNDEELVVLASMLGLRGVDERTWCAALAENFNLSLVALTRGARGALILLDELVSEYEPAPIQVVDTVGAGDSFTATVVAGLLKNLPATVINECACAIAAYVCGQRGATPSLPPELGRNLHSNTLSL